MGLFSSLEMLHTTLKKLLDGDQRSFFFNIMCFNVPKWEKLLTKFSKYAKIIMVCYFLLIIPAYNISVIKKEN